MKKIMLVACIMALCLSASALYKLEQITIIPGESSKLLDMEISWEAGQDANVKFDGGALEIKGPERSMRIEDLDGHFYAYLDGVILSLRSSFPEDPDGTSIVNIQARRQPRILGITQEEAILDKRKRVFLSSLSPVDVHEWELRVSPEPRELPSGNNRHIITAENTETGEIVEFPALEDTLRNPGRFQMEVVDFYEASKTAVLDLRASPDPDVKGKMASVNGYTLTGNGERTINAVLRNLSQRYDFEVEWMEYPSQPDAWEDIKNTVVKISVSKRDILLYDLVHNILANSIRDAAIKAEWVTPRKVLIKNSRFLEKEKELGKLKERREEIARFQKEYSLETKVYSFDFLDIDTAAEIVEPLLHKYSLTGFVKSGEDDMNYSVEKDAYFSKKTGPSGYREVLSSVEEKLIKDKDNEVILVMAARGTHVKIEEALSSVSSLLKNDENAGVRPLLTLNLKMFVGNEIPGEKKDAMYRIADENGIPRKDLEEFGFTNLKLLGSGSVKMMQERGEAGTVTMGLGNDYLFRGEFLEKRSPYIIMRCSLQRKTEKGERLILTNSLYLKSGAPTPLGITNMSGGLILVLTCDEDAG